MNRAEFMRRLTELLGDVSPMERDEAIQYYNDYFDDAGAENESSVIASLGTPEELARTIKAGLNDGGNSGEFTESGFSGYTQAHRDELARTDEVNREGNRNNGAEGFRSAEQSGTGSAAGQNGGMGSAAGQNGSMSGAAGQNGGMGGSAGHNGNAGNGYYQGGYYQRNGSDRVYGGREDTRRHGNPYEQNGFNHYDGSNDSNSAGASSDGRYHQSKQGMSGGTVVLIVILAVLTSPVWLGLLGALFGVAVALLATLLGIFAAFLIAGVAFVVVSFVLLIAGFGMLFSVPIGGVCMIGSALIVFSLGLVFVWLMVLMAGTAIPAFVRGVASLCRRLFGRGGAKA
ncbi:MAG: hypothetical protein HFI57_10075 [Lachnospiraceae bacterium]|nr:hypothetical protein [Lachnospiraceae bacterium]